MIQIAAYDAVDSHSVLLCCVYRMKSLREYTQWLYTCMYYHLNFKRKRQATDIFIYFSKCSALHVCICWYAWMW